MAQSALKGCEICERGSGSHLCLDCEQFICDDCKKLHARQKFSKNHQFESDSNVIPEVKLRCKEHNDDFLFLCVQCNELVCRRCVSGTHKGHVMSDIDDVIVELKKSVITSTEWKSKQTDDVIHKLGKGLDSLETDKKNAIEKIQEEGAKMKELIDQQIKKKIVSVEEKVKVEKDKLSRMLSEANEIKERVNELQRQFDEINHNKEDGLLLEKLKVHMELLDNTKSVTVDTLPVLTYISKTVTLGHIAKLMGTCHMEKCAENPKVTPSRQQTREQQPNQRFEGRGYQQYFSKKESDRNEDNVAQSNAAAWEAYYAQFYDQQPHDKSQQQQPFQQQPAPDNPQTGKSDYSEEWAEYFRQQGMFTQAERVLQQAKAKAVQTVAGTQFK